MTAHFMNQILGKLKLNVKYTATFGTIFKYHVKIRMGKIMPDTFRQGLLFYFPVS